MISPAFELPAHLEAHEPPEARGLSRDRVRLMIASRSAGTIVHTRFDELPNFLSAGDLLVVNTSATLPAALPALGRDGARLELHVSTPSPGHPGDHWVVEGRPIRYRYVPEPWPLEAYQTVYALEPGSAEMPSGGRPLSAELLTRLAASGILVTPITLHAGVSSPERHEPPYPERYRVPEETARLANAVHGWGGRVIAVGTTVVRALESVAGPGGGLTPGEGWTNLVVTAERGLWAVDGLLTGWHEPEASHLQMLRTVTGDELLERSYHAAIKHGYLWHEFGDSHLILP